MVWSLSGNAESSHLFPLLFEAFDLTFLGYQLIFKFPTFLVFSSNWFWKFRRFSSTAALLASASDVSFLTRSSSRSAASFSLTMVSSSLRKEDFKRGFRICINFRVCNELVSTPELKLGTNPPDGKPVSSYVKYLLAEMLRDDNDRRMHVVRKSTCPRVNHVTNFCFCVPVISRSVPTVRQTARSTRHQFLFHTISYNLCLLLQNPTFQCGVWGSRVLLCQSPGIVISSSLVVFFLPYHSLKFSIHSLGGEKLLKPVLVRDALSQTELTQNATGDTDGDERALTHSSHIEHGITESPPGTGTLPCLSSKGNLARVLILAMSAQTGNGLIQKYGLNMQSQCFHRYVKDRGFSKLYLAHIPYAHLSPDPQQKGRVQIPAKPQNAGYGEGPIQGRLRTIAHPTTLSELRLLNPIQKTLVHSQDWSRHLFTCAQAVVALVKQR
ncbi:hypothetical protein GH733_000477 [Mirounga leonina]|nr:hypothetical protein GH733_000477 [Mirounga leonina]